MYLPDSASPSPTLLLTLQAFDSLVMPRYLNGPQVHKHKHGPTYCLLKTVAGGKIHVVSMNAESLKFHFPGGRFSITVMARGRPPL